MRKYVVAALSLVALLLAAAPVHAQESTPSDSSEVTFIHGIRGFFTDVYLDDELILQGFAPERITEPMNLKKGTHRIDLRDADAPADAKPVVTKTFDVPAGRKLTAIAHWTNVEDCTITLFDDSGDVVDAGSSKLIARHAAAIGDVDLTVDDMATGSPLGPAKEYVESVKPGAHTVAVDDTEKGSLITSSRVPVDEGNARVVYLVGSAKEHTLALLTQTVSGLESDPEGVPTGNSGLAVPGSAAPWFALAALAALAAAVIAGRGRALTRRG